MFIYVCGNKKKILLRKYKDIIFGKIDIELFRVFDVYMYVVNIMIGFGLKWVVFFR